MNNNEQKNKDENSANEFDESLKKLDQSDIKESFKGKPASIINSVFILRMLMLVVCASVFMYSVYSIYQKVADGIRTEKLLSGIVDTANVKSAVSRVTTIKNAQTTLSLYDALGSKDSDNKTEEIIDQTGEYDAIRFRILDLKAENSDIYGWIRITGMVADTVEYPVVKGSDNSVYLYRQLHEVGVDFCRRGQLTRAFQKLQHDILRSLHDQRHNVPPDHVLV